MDKSLKVQKSKRKKAFTLLFFSAFLLYLIYVFLFLNQVFVSFYIKSFIKQNLKNYLYLQF